MLSGVSKDSVIFSVSSMALFKVVGSFNALFDDLAALSFEISNLVVLSWSSLAPWFASAVMSFKTEVSKPRLSESMSFFGLYSMGKSPLTLPTELDYLTEGFENSVLD
jgi:hypothetical protein